MPVSQDLIDQTWTTDVARIVSAVARKAPGAPCDPLDLIAACKIGQHQLWLVKVGNDVVALAITGIVKEPLRAVCEWIVMGGRDYEEADCFREAIENWAKEQGCAAMRSFSRPGMRKRLPRSYRVRGTIFEKAL